jgi:hypothetical protein
MEAIQAQAFLGKTRGKHRASITTWLEALIFLWGRGGFIVGYSFYVDKSVRNSLRGLTVAKKQSAWLVQHPRMHLCP